MTYDILLATYNGCEYLESMLDSILAQTIPPRRVLVSDDGSSDSTISILHSWIKDSALEVEILPQLSTRLGSTRNFERLLVHSDAKYVLLADQDDIWHPLKAERMLNFMSQIELASQRSQPLLIYTDLSLIDSFSKVFCNSFFRYQRLNPYKSDWLSIGIQNVVTGCACMVNRDAIMAALPFPEEAIMHDWWLALGLRE